jgi:protein TonB
MSDFSKNDWIGLGVSVLLHVAAMLLFLMVTTSPRVVSAGFVEVEFGDFSTVRPVQETQPEEPIEESADVDEDIAEPEPVEAEDAAKQVDLPDQQQPVPDEEIVDSPDTDVVSPEQSEDEPVITEDDATPGDAAANPGVEAGTTGAESGDEGDGVEEERAAPYILEGIDRIPIRTDLPAYEERVNAVIQVQITVDPRGRIIRIVPLRKGNPTLEQAVMDALRRWQFNPLAPNVPRENQTGRITFRFRLE